MTRRTCRLNRRHLIHVRACYHSSTKTYATHYRPQRISLQRPTDSDGCSAWRIACLDLVVASRHWLVQWSNNHYGLPPAAAAAEPHHHTALRCSSSSNNNIEGFNSSSIEYRHSTRAVWGYKSAMKLELVRTGQAYLGRIESALNGDSDYCVTYLRNQTFCGFNLLVNFSLFCWFGLFTSVPVVKICILQMNLVATGKGDEIFAFAVGIISFSNCLLFCVYDTRDTRSFRCRRFKTAVSSWTSLRSVRHWVRNSSWFAFSKHVNPIFKEQFTCWRTGTQ